MTSESPVRTMRPVAFRTRRVWLRTLAGASLALPLSAVRPGRAGGAAYPQRLLVFFTPNGTVGSEWFPEVEGPDFELSTVLAPLAPQRQDLVVLGGIDAESSYHGPGDQSHWNGMGHLLTGTELVELGPSWYWAGGISLDQAIAAAVGPATKLSSLELSVSWSPATVASRLSYRGAALPMPPEHDPAQAFQRVFADLPPELLARRRSVLDGTGAQLSQLRARVDPIDRHKIEQHLGAVRELERSLWFGPSCSTDAPAAVSAEDFPLAGKAQMDLVVRAFACDVTRVATLMWSQAVGMTVMPWLGVAEPHHTLSHELPENAAAQADLVKIGQWYASQLGYLIEALRAVPEGDGTLLDNTLVLWCSEVADGPSHSRRDLPLVLAGRAGGKLTTGRYVRFDHTGEARPHNDLLSYVAQTFGLELATFGNPAYNQSALEL